MWGSQNSGRSCDLSKKSTEKKYVQSSDPTSVISALDRAVIHSGTSHSSRELTLLPRPWGERVPVKFLPFCGKTTYSSRSRKAQDPNDAERPSSSAQHSHSFQQHKTGLRQLRTQMLHNHELNFPDPRRKTLVPAWWAQTQKSFRMSCSRPNLFTNLEGTLEILC